MILKLKRTPGIYVVGFMASGKTTIGRLLARRLGWDFVDLDDDVEAAAKMSISEIFEQRGEPEFRRLETEALRSRVRAIESGKPTVIALGGGTFVQPENAALIADNGVTIWLDCPFTIVKRRVERAAHRPLARDAALFAQLFEERRQHYARAEYRIPIEGENPEPVVEAVLRLPLFE